MGLINLYDIVPVPKLADKLIGTSVGGEPQNVTYNFTLQELLNLFIAEIPSNTLQEVLDAGHIAYQDIKLYGDISATTLSINGLSSLFNVHISGSLYDKNNSTGTSGQFLMTTGAGIDWVTINYQELISLTTIGSNGEATFISDVLNIPNYTLSGLGGVPSSRTLTINGTTYDLTANRSWNIGTITSVTASAPLSSTGGNTPDISISKSDASTDGYLTSIDWTTFNNKQIAGNYITQLSGEATASGPGNANTTLVNSAVIGKVLTGLNVTGGTVLAADSILSAFGKVQNQINGLIGGSIYEGTWNALTNAPTLTSSIGDSGSYYIVNVAGSTNLNGITDWNIGDWAIFNGGVWQKVDNTDAVISVNGYIGAVNLVTGDIFEGAGSLPGRPSQLYFTVARSRSSLSFVSGSGGYDNSTGIITIPTNTSELTNGAAYITLGNLSANSPLSYNNGTGAFSIQAATTSQNGYLSSTDWNTFYNKQSTLSGTGLVKSTAGVITYISDDSANWTTAYNDSIVSAAVSGTTTKTLTLTQHDGGTVTASWTDADTGLTSVGVSMPSAFSVANSPLTSNGTINITGAGTALQYINGLGQLATLGTNVLDTLLTGFIATQGVVTSADTVLTGLEKIAANALDVSSTGVYSFAGLTLASSTTFNVGAAKGFIVDNTTNISYPTVIEVNYAGATNLTDPNLNTSTETYVLLNASGTLVLQPTFPTPAERRLNIFLGKLGHPDKLVFLNAFSQPDVFLSPLSQLRDVWAPINLINGGIYPSPNGANLTFKTSAGSLSGLGINFSNNPLAPSTFDVPAQVPATFRYRTQTGGTSGNTTLVDPTRYDLNGAVTLISGAGGKATNQRVYCLQNGQIRIQYGQQVYNSLTEAVQGIQSEIFVTFPNFIDNAILIGILSVTKNCTDLTVDNKAKILLVSKFGESVGSAGGVSTTTLQQAYNNSIQPEIVTNSTLGAVTFKRGSAADTDNVIEIQDGAGVNTAYVDGLGNITANSFIKSLGTSTQFLKANGTIDSSAYIVLGSLSTISPLNYNNATGVFSITQSGTSTNGYLSSTDWNTFNNKQAAGNYITSLLGEATGSGPGAASVTLNNASVTAKVLTGVNITGGTVLATDTMLTAFGKLQNQINGLVGGSIYQGTWNANTNNPSLTSGVGVKGYYYIVNVAGTTNLDGISDWFVGDWAIFDGTAWQQVDNTDAVVSVNGQTGAVSLTTDNIPEGATNKYYLDSRARASLSFAAGSGAYNSTTGLITIPTNTSQLTNGGGYITLASLSGTAPIGYNNTTGVISITQSGVSSNGYLSSTDWNIFNGKQTALSGTGFVKISGTTISYDNSTYQPLLTNPVTGMGTSGYHVKWTGTNTVNNSVIYDDGTNVGIGTTTNIVRKLTIYSATPDNQLLIGGAAPSVRLVDTLVGSTYTALFGLATSANNYLTNSIAGDFCITAQAGNNILWGVNSVEKMRLSANGNLLIGTPTDAGYKLDVNGTGRFSGNLTIGQAIAATNVKLLLNGVLNKAAGIEFQQSGVSQWYLGNGAASEDNNFELYNSNGTMAMKIIKSTNAINFTGAATFSSSVTSGSTASSYVTLNSNSIAAFNAGTPSNLYFNYTGGDIDFAGSRVVVKASGNVGIGTTSPSTKLHVKGVLSIERSITGDVSTISNEGGNFYISASSGYNTIFQDGSTERMRITSDGATLIGATSLPSSTISGVALQNPRTLGATLFSVGTVTDGRTMVQFLNGNGVVGSIVTNGSATLYNVTSDYRLKQDFKDYKGLELLSEIKTYDYEWKSDKTRMFGVIAHELQEVLPYAVYGEKDAESMQQVDYSKLVPIMIKAIQELKQELNELKNK